MKQFHVVIPLLLALCLILQTGTPTSVSASTVEEESNFYGEIQLSNVMDTSAYLNATNIVNAIKQTGMVPRNIRWYLKQGIYGSKPLTDSLSIIEESNLSYRMTDLTPGTVYKPFVMITYFDMENGVQHIYKSYSQFSTTGTVPTPTPVVSATPEPEKVTEPTPPLAAVTPTGSAVKPVTLKQPKMKGFRLTNGTATGILATKYPSDVTFEYRFGTKSGNYPVSGTCNGDIIANMALRGVWSLQVRACVMSNGKMIYSKWSKKKWAVSEPSTISAKMKGKKSKKRLRISFGKVDGAKKYKVCYRKSGSTEWSTLCTTKKRVVYSKRLAKRKKVAVAVVAIGSVKGKTVKSDVNSYLTYYSKSKTSKRYRR